MADKDAVAEAYARLGNARAAARELGLADVTVYQILRTQRGKCRLCSGDQVPGRSHCQVCLDRLAEQSREKAVARARKGLCRWCDQPIQPPSRSVCLDHREQHRQASARHKRKQPRGVASHKQRRRSILTSYGSDAAGLWDEKEGRCEICSRHHSERRTVIHHLDLDRSHADNSRTNLALLCVDCHRLVHALVEQTEPRALLSWVAERYPTTQL